MPQANHTVIAVKSRAYFKTQRLGEQSREDARLCKSGRADGLRFPNALYNTVRSIRTQSIAADALRVKGSEVRRAISENQVGAEAVLMSLSAWVRPSLVLCSTQAREGLNLFAQLPSENELLSFAQFEFRPSRDALATRSPPPGVKESVPVAYRSSDTTSIADELDSAVVHPTPPRSVLDAALALLEARENQMVTCVEWDQLPRAVAAAEE